MPANLMSCPLASTTVCISTCYPSKLRGWKYTFGIICHHGRVGMVILVPVICMSFLSFMSSVSSNLVLSVVSLLETLLRQKFFNKTNHCDNNKLEECSVPGAILGISLDFTIFGLCLFSCCRVRYLRWRDGFISTCSKLNSPILTNHCWDFPQLI